jgi:response regulator RpfG family c-di-GMP phosphodiesterase/tRNA A-37 threonylcarbamoyl transferase component Bud32
MTARSFSPDDLLPAGRSAFLDQLIRAGLLTPAERQAFLLDRVERLREYASDERLAQALIQAGLLTPYQAERVLAGQLRGLVLSSYRVLEELGQGGMGTVYLAEHRLMKRRVAVKVVPQDDGCSPVVRQRFYAEVRVLAELSHPHIVLALDAGELPAEGREPALVYLVMEYVEGGDLERLVARHGACGIAQACHYIRQAAAGLQAAHDRHLIHRDLRPSNLLLGGGGPGAGPAQWGQVKLVDFGLARQFGSRLTDPRALLGSVDFMPPEQSHDPSTVGKEADVYGLGATLFWLLTREGPYPHTPSLAQALRQLQQQEPRRLRQLRPDVPAALDELVHQMLDRRPDHRPASPLAVANALRPFQPERPISLPSSPRRPDAPAPRILIVAGEIHLRRLCRTALEALGCECREARDGRAAVEAAVRLRFDVVILDLDLPVPDGGEVFQLRSEENPHLKVIVVGGSSHPSEPDEALPSGADDWLPRPFEPRQLETRVRHALQLKAAQDRADELAEKLAQSVRDQERSQAARHNDLREAHNALLFALARVGESRDGETPGHLRRLQEYTRVLAVEAAREPPWRGLVTEPFLEQLCRCVPLHDIGKIGLPDDVLLKPASLTPAERALVETHVLVGDRILAALARAHGAALDFLGMARSIVRSHHERHDGRGYPDRLAGEAIPPAARLVAIADVYDTLRRMRLYKPAMSHGAALRVILERSEGQFDPALLRALKRCHGDFERIYGDVEE